MTEQEKQAACLRICGPNVHPKFQRIAPELCPLKQDEWRGIKSRPAKAQPPPEKLAVEKEENLWES